MAQVHAIYQKILTVKDPTVDRAMVAALPTAEPTMIQLLARAILQRGRPEGELGLLLYYHRLPQDIQTQLVDIADRLSGALRQASSRKQSEGPANAMRIIRQAKSTKLAYLATEQLRHGDELLKQAAADCLLEMAHSSKTDTRPQVLPAIQADQIEYLQTAIEESVSQYDIHHIPNVLIAMMFLLPRPMHAAFATLSQSRHAAVEPMRSIAAKAASEPVRQALLPLLLVPTLHAAVLEGLHQCRAANSLGEVLANYHMLKLEPVRKCLANHKAAKNLLPDQNQIDTMPEYQVRGLPAWIMTMNLDNGEKLACLSQFAGHPDFATRLFVLRRLIDLIKETNNTFAQNMMVRFCYDPEVSIARIAIWYLIRSRYHGLAKVLAALVNSNHPELRRIAGKHLAPLGFARLWENWPELDHQRKLSAGRALIKIDPDFHRQLGEKLRINDRTTRLRALAIITELNQGIFFEQALAQLARVDDKMIASAAVKALGSASAEFASNTLENALKHNDSRVRANAVEALSQLNSSRHVQTLIDMSHNEDHRPRANAIKALIDTMPEHAVSALAQMLADPRPKHRTSALWLVESMELLMVAHHVAEMSISDPDDSVKERAKRVINDLIELLDSTCPITGSDQNQSVA